MPKDRPGKVKKTQSKSKPSKVKNVLNPFFSKYFELGLVGMAITAPNKKWVLVNDRMTEILGYPKEQLLQKSWDEVTHPDDLSENLESFDKILRGELDHYRMEKRFIRNDGKIISAIVSVNCLRRPDGRVEYLLALVEDISEQKRVEIEKMKLQEQITHSAKLATLGTLGAGLAHELNNPLTIIKGCADLILRKLAMNGLDPERLKDMVAQIREQSERMVTIIGHIREFGRNTWAEKAIHANVNDIIQDSMLLLRKQFENHRINFDIRLTPNLPLLWAKKVKLESVFQNLLANSKDVLDPLDSIVSASGQEKKITIASVLSVDGRFIEIYFSDNGPGIAPQNLPHIFDPFFTTKEKGMGLGLALAHDVIKEHGGEITVKGESGQGTTFKISLPVTEQNQFQK